MKKFIGDMVGVLQIKHGNQYLGEDDLGFEVSYLVSKIPLGSNVTIIVYADEGEKEVCV